MWHHKGSGPWCKKIRGKRHYFGTDKDAALAESMRLKDDLEAGRVAPPPDDQRVKLVSLVAASLTHTPHQVQTGELASRTFELYCGTSEKLLTHFGETGVVDQLRRQGLNPFKRYPAVAGEKLRLALIPRAASEMGGASREGMAGAVGAGVGYTQSTRNIALCRRNGVLPNFALFRNQGAW
ncbi:MAG: hypothetical protein ACOC7K_01745 [bacterium]